MKQINYFTVVHKMWLLDCDVSISGIIYYNKVNTVVMPL